MDVIKNLIAIILITMIASVTLFSNIQKSYESGDEAGWISTSNYYTDLVFKKDLDRSKWNCAEKCNVFGGLYNPHTAQFIIGSYLKIINNNDYFGLYNWKKSIQENKADKTFPSKGNLYEARKVSAFFGVLTCLVILAIGYYSFNIYAGFAASLLVAFNPLFITLSSQAMTDIYYNFFMLLAVLISVFLIKEAEHKIKIALVILCATFFALAASVKITAVVLGTMYFTGILIYLALVKGKIVKDKLVHLLMFSFKYLSVFVIVLFTVLVTVNPSFWVLDDSAGDIRPPGYDNGPVEFFNSFGRWSHLLQEFPKEYKIKEPASKLKFIIGYQTIKTPLLLLLAMVMTSIATYFKMKVNKYDTIFVTIIYFLVNLLFVMLFVNLSFDRYFLSTAIASQMIIAVSLIKLIELLKNYVSAHIKNANTRIEIW